MKLKYSKISLRRRKEKLWKLHQFLFLRKLSLLRICLRKLLLLRMCRKYQIKNRLYRQFLNIPAIARQFCISQNQNAQLHFINRLLDLQIRFPSLHLRNNLRRTFPQRKNSTLPDYKLSSNFPARIRLRR